MYKIEIYEDKNGKSEVKEYIRNLEMSNSKDSRIRYKKILMYIDLISKKGLNLREPYIKHLTGSIWELRPSRNRILFANIPDNRFILLSIFMKKTIKTPKDEIKKAKKLLNDLKERGIW